MRFEMIKSNVTKTPSVANKLYNVWVHDLRTKDETSCFKVKAKSKDEAEKLYQAYWDNTPALKELKVNLEKYWESTNKEYILALDGRRLNSRSQHSLLNLLFQGAGSIAVKYTIMLVAQYLEERGKLGLVDSDTFEESIQKVYQMIVYHK